jgi:hypothetical protein
MRPTETWQHPARARNHYNSGPALVRPQERMRLMERIFLKGLLLIVGMWVIWNSSKGISEVAKITLKDSREKAKEEAPIAVKALPEETKPQGTGGKFYMRKLED